MDINRKILIFVVAVLAMPSCIMETAGDCSLAEPAARDAYLAVNLSIGDDGTETRSPTYENGSEHTVENAHFYFYDEKGHFVSEAEVWSDGDTDNNTKYIEYNGGTVIILKGLTSQTYPAFVVTVLNEPSGFSVPETIDDFTAVISGGDSAGILDSSGNYVMTTSSYSGASTDFYCVTELNSDYFSAEPLTETDGVFRNSDGDEVPILDIYVERLAAKVNVSLAEGFEGEHTYSDGHGGNYPMFELENQTVAGTLTDEILDLDNINSSTSIYVALIGWRLNATARSSFLIKNIDTSWDPADWELNPGWEWNFDSEYNSLWGKSTVYGHGGFPTSSGGNTDDDEAGDGENDPLSDYLTYVSLNSCYGLGNEDTEYCAENTNTLDVIKSDSLACTTSVLIKALACDEGENPLNIVKYKGVLYSRNAFMDYIIQAAGVNAWYLDDGTYKIADHNHAELTDLLDGYVGVSLKDDGTAYYEKSLTPDSDGSYFHTTTTVEEANAVLASYCSRSSSGYNALAYTGGQMYYDIPIRHAGFVDGEVVEGTYGVVRNCRYSIRLTGISALGWGIYDEDDVIVPQTSEGLYYIFTNLSVLDWRLNEEYPVLK